MSTPIIIIIICTLVTFFERAFSFLIFGNREVPAVVKFLGKASPAALMATLIVYCLKGISFAEPALWAPSIIAVACTAALHLWKSNSLISIFGGTAIYMVLINLVFV